jgi:membrane-bound inhibitor of C-type lysozyme
MDKIKKIISQLFSSTKDLSKIIFDLIKDGINFLVTILDRKNTLTEEKKSTLVNSLSYIFVIFLSFSFLENTGIYGFVKSIELPSFSISSLNTGSENQDKDSKVQVAQQNVDPPVSNKPDCMTVSCSQVEFGSNVPAKYANTITVSWCEAGNTTKIITDTTQTEVGDGISAQSQVPSRVLEGSESKITEGSVTFNTISTRSEWILDRSNGILKAYNMDNSAQVLDSYRCVKGSPNL